LREFTDLFDVGKIFILLIAIKRVLKEQDVSLITDHRTLTKFVVRRGHELQFPRTVRDIRDFKHFPVGSTEYD